MGDLIDFEGQRGSTDLWGGLGTPVPSLRADWAVGLGPWGLADRGRVTSGRFGRDLAGASDPFGVGTSSRLGSLPGAAAPWRGLASSRLGFRVRQIVELEGKLKISLIGFLKSYRILKILCIGFLRKIQYS